jgi:hypothetical protein
MRAVLIAMIAVALPALGDISPMAYAAQGTSGPELTRSPATGGRPEVTSVVTQPAAGNTGNKVGPDISILGATPEQVGTHCSRVKLIVINRTKAKIPDSAYTDNPVYFDVSCNGLLIGHQPLATIDAERKLQLAAKDVNVELSLDLNPGRKFEYNETYNIQADSTNVLKEPSENNNWFSAVSHCK